MWLSGRIEAKLKTGHRTVSIVVTGTTCLHNNNIFDQKYRARYRQTTQHIQVTISVKN